MRRAGWVLDVEHQAITALARDTQMSMLAQVSRSSSVNRSSRWSTSPDSTAVSQVRQNPISHEDGCSTPASRTGSSSD